MPLFKYQPYYKYNGPTFSEPFREELDEEDVKHNINLFFDEIGDYFSDVDATVERIEDCIICITACITEDDCDSRVKRCLNSLDLYAKKILEE